jgi:TolB-like protein/Tfp pilus assembly protein PilF
MFHWITAVACVCQAAPRRPNAFFGYSPAVSAQPARGSAGEATVTRFLKELRRRRVFRVAGLYVVAIWLVMQAADVLFPGWGIPDAAIRYLLWAGLLGFPVALVFGWVFDVSAQGIRRTQPALSDAELLHALPLRRTDFLILGAFLLVVGAIIYDTAGRVMETATDEAWRPTLAEVEPNSVAVLPFVSMSPDPEQAYFADGMSEEILNRLSAFRELKVIARTSSFAFKDSGYDIARISGLLAVQFLLQGSVRRDGERLRIAAQLVDRSGVQVWSSTYDRALGGIFDLQDEIAEAVAVSIAPQIVPLAAEHRQPDLEAYQEYLIGRDLMARRVPGYVFLVEQRFSRAIELDPQFAEPYAERALALAFDSTQSDDAAAALEQAQHDIDTALALSPDLARAHAIRAIVLLHAQQGSFAEQEAALRRALEFEPNLADAWYWLSWPLEGQGRFAEAYEALQRAVRLEPLGPAASRLAYMDAQLGNTVEAERRLLRLIEVPQPSGPPFHELIDLYMGTGRLVEAIELIKRYYILETVHSGRPLGYFRLSRAYGLLGLWEKAEYWQDRWERDYGGDLLVRLARFPNLALVAGYLGHEEAAGQLRGILQSAGVELGSLQPDIAAIYGILQALAGDHRAAVQTLKSVDNLDLAVTSYISRGMDVRGDALHALGWALFQTGEPESAAELLAEESGQFCGARLAEAHQSGDLHFCAQHAVLLCEHPRAIELLERAADAGWRGYFAILRDPRWDAVAEDPQFQAVLARVKADIDR